MWFLGPILNFFANKSIGVITGQLKDAYRMKLEAETSEKKLEADTYIAHLQAQQEVLLTEQGRWLTAWIRPAMALPVVLYMWKLIIWDTLLQWGVTQNPGEFVNWMVVTVIGAYMLTRPFEKR
jgi:hypothetical protein